jgi:3-(3-hydroxy-phenyl)propionate hydroxylase
MDEVMGNGWRLVLAAGVPMPATGEAAAFPGLQVLGLDENNEAEGVGAAWLHRHACAAALVRPDNYVYGVAASMADIPGLLDEAANALGLSLCPI